MNNNKIGFLVINRKSGFAAEGKNHAARIFETESDAQNFCGQGKLPMRLSYQTASKSLLGGAAFCFDTEACHARFLKCVRNDPHNRPFVAFSRDRTFVQWRKSDNKPDPQHNPAANLVTDMLAQTPPARSAPVETPTFNPAILARTGNP